MHLQTIQHVDMLNPCGFNLQPTGNFVPGWPWFLKRREYELTLLDPPLTLHCWPGDFFVQCDRHGITDMGSVPEPVQLVVPKDYALASFVIHDSGCREHGLYFSHSVNGPYTFCPMDSKSVHHLLRLCVEAERDNYVMAWVIWAAVHRWGPQFA